MGLRDDDQSIFEERALLDWAREAPRSPGSYDYAPSEEESAAYEYEQRKWMEKKPAVSDGYGDRFSNSGGGGVGGGNFSSVRVQSKTKAAPVKKMKTITTKEAAQLYMDQMTASSPKKTRKVVRKKPKTKPKGKHTKSEKHKGK